jgi:hypothetical protein
MEKAEFKQLFLRALGTAAENAEMKLKRPIPRSFIIELYSITSSGTRLSIDDTIEKLYLGENSFYKIIDVAIKELLEIQSVAFVRVSGHAPSTFNKTWDPSNMGPFKQIISDKIEDKSTSANNL